MVTNQIRHFHLLFVSQEKKNCNRKTSNTQNSQGDSSNARKIRFVSQIGEYD